VQLSNPPQKRAQMAATAWARRRLLAVGWVIRDGCRINTYNRAQRRKSLVSYIWNDGLTSDAALNLFRPKSFLISRMDRASSNDGPTHQRSTSGWLIGWRGLRQDSSERSGVRGHVVRPMILDEYTPFPSFAASPEFFVIIH
jgi:hypothetical protein